MTSKDSDEKPHKKYSIFFIPYLALHHVKAWQGGHDVGVEARHEEELAQPEGLQHAVNRVALAGEPLGVVGDGLDESVAVCMAVQPQNKRLQRWRCIVCLEFWSNNFSLLSLFLYSLFISFHCFSGKKRGSCVVLRSYDATFKNSMRKYAKIR